jgi:hypothetical protein
MTPGNLERFPATAPAAARSTATEGVPPRAGRRSTLERMPKWLICVPLTCQWLALALRHGSATLPSSANPSITAGGLIGEGKLEYFRGMGPIARAVTANHCAISTGSTLTGAQLDQHLSRAGLAFPLIAKPDLGLCGYGVRLLADRPALHAYLAAFPGGETVVLQHYLPQEGEAGIFYARDPRTERGCIIGLALRYFPRVVGDGHRCVTELIANDARARRMIHSLRHERHAPDARVPAAGEVVRLATIGSTRVGGLYRDGAPYITPELTAAIDAVARDMPAFHFGRFDVRFDSLADLSAGTGFAIMEINGAGSEAIQAWDPEISLFDGFRMIFAKQRLLFAIGAAMRRRGVRPIGLLALARLYRRQQRLIALYPPSN